MGKTSRSKGRRGETIAKNLLLDRDYQIISDCTSGLSTCDLVVESASGEILFCEVKNTKLINLPAFITQARTNAKKRPWLLLAKLDSTSSWLCMGKGRKAVIWHEKELNSEMGDLA